VSNLDRARLAAEILLTYLSIRWYLRRVPLPQVVARLRESGGATRGPLGQDDAVRLGHAVNRTLRRIPADTRCLVRSLVLMRLLARRGGDGELVIAARPAESARLDAHAWVEVGGRPVLPPAGSDYGRLVAL